MGQSSITRRQWTFFIVCVTRQHFQLSVIPLTHFHKIKDLKSLSVNFQNLYRFTYIHYKCDMCECYMCDYKCFKENFTFVYFNVTQEIDEIVISFSTNQKIKLIQNICDVTRDRCNTISGKLTLHYNISNVRMRQLTRLALKNQRLLGEITRICALA